MPSYSRRNMATLDIATLDGETAHLTDDVLIDLQSRIAGRVLRAGEDGWNEAVSIWNGLAANTPALVIQPSSAADVAAGVRFARDRRLLLSIKGGGHNIAGTAVAERGLMLDMSQMRDVIVDPLRKL